MHTDLKRTRRWVRTVAAVAAMSLVVAACGDADEPAAEGIEGMTVNIMSPWVDDDAAGFMASIEGWAEENGVELSHEGSGDFETLINTRVEGGNPPDIAMVPQPGLIADLHRSTGLRDLTEVIDEQEFESAVVEGLYDLGVVDGDFVGLIYRLSLKSMVWYPIPAFFDAGYERPETWDEMMALTDQIRADGTTPWCIGIESGGATGWTATDWFEDIMLRTAGPDAYDDWVTGDLPFNSPEVQRAGELFAELAFTDGNVLGGRQGIVTTSFGEAPNPMFEDPPACYLHRQASFIFSFFPDAIQEDLDNQVDFFPFPEIDPEHGTPALIAGDQAILFTDNPAAEALIQFMATDEGVAAWTEQGGTLSPHVDFDTSRYPTEIDAKQQEFLADASYARFDASDVMPAAVGAGSFWTQMTSWINGDVELEDALETIDGSWPN